MNFIWIIVPILALSIPLVAMYLDHQKNKMEMMNKSNQNQEEVDEVRKLVSSLKTRIENLEAIAAGSPDELTTGAGRGMEEIEIDERTSIKRENQQQVSDIADKRRNR